MRKILFRGQDVRGNWHVGLLAHIGNAWYISNSAGVATAYEVIPRTIGQYTDLNDKNGKKIFEGDLFQMEDDIIAVVIFEDGGFRLKSYGICGTFTENGFDEDGGGYGIIECEPIDWYYIHDMEVIGNIHDNPELLRKDDA